MGELAEEEGYRIGYNVHILRNSSTKFLKNERTWREISMDVIEELGNYSIDISKTIEEELSCIVPNNLQEASIYLTKAGGKMLRPAFNFNYF